MRVHIKARIENREAREKFADTMGYGGFDVTHMGTDVYCNFDGEIAEPMLRQLGLAAKVEQEAERQAIRNRCLEASGVTPCPT